MTADDRIMVALAVALVGVCLAARALADWLWPI